jgi:hypothetical protein
VKFHTPQGWSTTCGEISHAPWEISHAPWEISHAPWEISHPTNRDGARLAVKFHIPPVEFHTQQGWRAKAGR